MLCKSAHVVFLKTRPAHSESVKYSVANIFPFQCGKNFLKCNFCSFKITVIRLSSQITLQFGLEVAFVIANKMTQSVGTNRTSYRVTSIGCPFLSK
jgi:hypothetical protein